MSLPFDAALPALESAGLESAIDKLSPALNNWRARPPHGKTDIWDAALAEIQTVTPNDVAFNEDTVRIGRLSDVSSTDALSSTLRTFMPWRKGPFELYGVTINTEWRSDMKWQRLAPHLTPLKGRTVLDVGAGNGYYMFRCLGAGARFVLGVDPTLLFAYQFEIMRRSAGQVPVHLLPLRGEHLPPLGFFDTVFSLGVLYHRRSPLDHLAELLSQLRPGGELVLETLVIEGDEQEVLMPEDRYAKMGNVWFIPTPAALELWLARVGFENIRTVDVTMTTVREQRGTDWMAFESLPDFLDPENHELTVEGLPAPTRAIVIANRKSN